MTSRFRMNSRTRAALVFSCVLGLSACVEGLNPFEGGGGDTGGSSGLTPSGATRLVERDVEAPEIFQVTEAGLWDGRPSLGGVWVAHPDATDPERVLIRNEENDRFVIGALFRRERDNPGPALQVSSDAAAALKIVAGSPTALNVTALRREAAPPPLPESMAAPEGQAEVAAAGVTPSIQMGSLDALAATEAAIDQSETVATVPSAGSAPAAASAPAPGLERPFIQIGIFSIEENATNTAQSLRTAGMIPTIYDQGSNDRRFWRVVVGPSRTAAERDALLETVRGLGFQDAYFVTN